MRMTLSGQTREPASYCSRNLSGYALDGVLADLKDRQVWREFTSFDGSSLGFATWNFSLDVLSGFFV